MTAALTLSFALAAAQVDDPHVIDSGTVEKTPSLSGSDFLLISEAFRHPEMRERDLSCYHIVVFRERGTTTVAFLGDREPERQVNEGDQTIIIIPGPNPRCPGRSFVMDKRGRVARVIYERH
jgi:hypothetical protein